MLRNDHRQRPAALCALLCALTLSGCDDDPHFFIEEPPPAYDESLPEFVAPPTALVEGVVQLDGRALPGAMVEFQSPDTGARATGWTDNQGHYRLRSDRWATQIDVGRYIVKISTATPETPGSPAPPELLPAVYNRRSSRIVNVNPGMGQVNFLLRSDADRDWHELLHSTAFHGQPLSIILFVAEGLGPEWLGCYGGNEVETPHIDSLAARGLKFTNVYSMPQQVAARVSLLTGQYPCRHGWVGDWNVPGTDQGLWFDWEQYHGLGQRLSSVGFFTCIIGQWQLNDFQKQPDALLHHGFHRWCVWTGGAPGDQATREHHWNPHLYLNRPITHNEEERWPTTDVQQYDWGTAGVFPGEFGPDVFGAFLPNVTRRRSNRPFFLYYPIPLPAAAHPSAPDVAHVVIDDEAERYRSMVRYTDEAVGRLLAFLHETRRRERTFVIFTSDGGTPPGIAGGRGALTERGVRVPLIVSGPEIVPAGAESDALVDVTDLAPTVCDLALIQFGEPPEFDGHSFAPLLVGCADPEPRRWIMSQSGHLTHDGRRVQPSQPFAERVFRDQQYKVHVNPEREIDALYDLAADPAETRNLVASEAHRQVLERFRAVVDSFPDSDAAPQYTPFSKPAAARTTALPIQGTSRSRGG